MGDQVLTNRSTYCTYCDYWSAIHDTFMHNDYNGFTMKEVGTINVFLNRPRSRSKDKSIYTYKRQTFFHSCSNAAML